VSSTIERQDAACVQKVGLSGRENNTTQDVPDLKVGLLDHACGTRRQSIYGSATVSDSLNGC